MKNVAAIDLGTNTIRILVAQKDGAGYKTLFSSQIITRLGEGLHETGFLTKEAMERTANGVSGMVDEASRMCGPFSLKIFGAHACRKAKNIDQLSEIVKKATGAIITVLSWEDEASFALAGVRMVVGNDIKRFILFDIGGGSTEYILSDNNITSGAFGTDLGVIRLSGKFTTHHPVNADEYKALMVEVSNTVSLAFDNIGANGNEAIIGTAGTVTSLAAIAQNMQKYDYKKINNYRLTKEKIGEMKDRLFAMSIEERSEIEVLQDGREDLIVPGIAIIEATLNRAGANSMFVSDFGLREGLVMSLSKRMKMTARNFSVLLFSLFLVDLATLPILIIRKETAFMRSKNMMKRWRRIAAQKVGTKMKRGSTTIWATLFFAQVMLVKR